MKVSIGTNIKEGPWGGGNLFAKNLSEFLANNGHEVRTDLKDDDIDLILLTEPRRTSESSAFTHIDVQNYIKYIKDDSLVVHRVNECDERKNTNYVNKYLIEANKTADYTVFVSKWLRDLYVSQGIGTKEKHVIYAGASEKIFNDSDFIPWNKKSKLKIVTHHWGANWNKGFAIYSKLDELLYDKDWESKIDFTYIGNLPKGFKFKNAKVVKPLAGSSLSAKIKENHLYVTGSLFEPSGNHHIEASQCGLPIMFVNSGGTPEYCRDFGIEIDESNLESKLSEIMLNYDSYISKVKNYPFNSNKMCFEYESLFLEMFSKKNQILSDRILKLNGNLFERYLFSYKRNKK